MEMRTKAMDKKKILSIEDDEDQRKLIQETLEREGYEVHLAASGEEGVQMLDDLRPDLVLLDLMLPGMDGLAACRQIRSVTTAPIIMVTAKGDEVDKVIGLELGADDYLAKPFGLRELVARVRAMLRRMGVLEQAGLAQQRLNLPGLQIDVPARAVHVQNVAVTLTPKEFDLLYYLVSQPRHVFSRAKLMEKVWGYQPEGGDLRTVDTHIKRLRRKLEESHQVPWSIVTVWGVGYKFQMRE
jgi:two-component system response regulator ResD